MAFLLILLGICIIACIIRYATEGTCSAYPSNSGNKPHTPLITKPLSELSTEELQAKLSEAENEIETQKIKYQGSLSNPYVWTSTRNLIKSNLDSSIKLKECISDEIKKRNRNNIKNSAISESASLADELKKLKELLDAGVLTQEEFDAQKKKLLDTK